MVSIRHDDKSRRMTKELVIKPSEGNELEQVAEGIESRKNGHRRQHVCISPRPSVVYVDNVDSSSEEEKIFSTNRKNRRRSSLPILPPKPVCLRNARNHSAPVSPLSRSPLISRKSSLSNPVRKSTFPWVSKVTVSRQIPEENVMVVSQLFSY